MITPHLSTKKLALMVEEMFDIEKFDLISENIGIMEQAETQRLVNQIQQTLQAEDMTPSEDEDESEMV